MPYNLLTLCSNRVCACAHLIGGGHLSLKKIHEIMNVDVHDGTREPVHDPISLALIAGCVLLTTLSLPWWGDM